MVEGFGCGLLCLGSWVSVFGFWVSGFGFQVLGFGLKDLDKNRDEQVEEHPVSRSEG